MDPLFGVVVTVLADLDGQNLRFRDRLASHRLNLRVCVFSFLFQQDEEYYNGWALNSLTVCIGIARVLSFFRYDGCM